MPIPLGFFQPSVRKAPDGKEVLGRSGKTFFGNVSEENLHVGLAVGRQGKIDVAAFADGH